MWDMAQSAGGSVTPQSGVTRKDANGMVSGFLSFPRRRESMGSTQELDKRNRAAGTTGSHKDRGKIVLEIDGKRKSTLS
jgi:hypothetical protein